MEHEQRYVHLGAGAGAPPGPRQHIDGESVMTKDDLLTELSTALRFPDYFRRNWDAFEECLRAVIGSPGTEPRIVQIDASALVQSRLPADTALLQEIWAEVSEGAPDGRVPPHLVLA